MARMGMDADAVESAGRALKERAGQIDAIVSNLDRSVKGLLNVWDGPDAQTFVHKWWPEHRAVLVGAGSHVDGLGQSALNNASEQRGVSDEKGDRGTTSPNLGGRDAVTPGSTVNTGSGSPGETLGVVSPPTGGRDAYAATWGNPDVEQNDGHGAFSGNCTSWAAFRRHELGLPHLGAGWEGTGHGAEMAARLGGVPSTPPTLGAVASWGPVPGHVMVIEEIYPDGRFRVSEMNVAPEGQYNPVLGNVRTDRIYSPVGDGTWTSGNGVNRDLTFSAPV